MKPMISVPTFGQTSDHFLFMEIFISPKISPKISPNSYMVVIRQDIIEKTSAAESVFPRYSTVECIIDPIIFHDASSFFDQYVRPLLTSQNWRIQQFMPRVKWKLACKLKFTLISFIYKDQMFYWFSDFIGNNTRFFLSYLFNNSAKFLQSCYLSSFDFKRAISSSCLLFWNLIFRFKSSFSNLSHSSSSLNCCTFRLSRFSKFEFLSIVIVMK